MPCELLTACEELIFKSCGRRRSCFLRNFVFHTLCFSSLLPAHFSTIYHRSHDDYQPEFFISTPQFRPKISRHIDATNLLSLTVLDYLTGIRMGTCSEMTASWCSGCNLILCGPCTVLHSRYSPHELGKNDSHVLLGNDTFCDTLCTRTWISSQFSSREACIFGTLFPYVGQVCQWEPYWIPIGESFQKAYLEEWIHMGDDSSSNLGEQCMANIPTMVLDAEYNECTTI